MVLKTKLWRSGVDARRETRSIKSIRWMLFLLRPSLRKRVVQDSSRAMASALPRISVIVPVHNASATILEALASVRAQTYAGEIEVVAYDDCSSDDSVRRLSEVRDAWGAEGRNLRLIVRTSGDVGAVTPHGPGFARNRAAEAATGDFLCWLDSDDVCEPGRLEAQWRHVASTPSPHRTLVGGGFTRLPLDATPVYSAWANGQADDHTSLASQAWREIPLIQPTWFLSRAWFAALGGYDELPPLVMGRGGEGEGAARHGSPLERHAPILAVPPRRVPLPEAATGEGEERSLLTPAAGSSPPSQPFTVFPEDTVFLHRHLAAGGLLRRVPHTAGPILQYRFNAGSLTWRTSREVLTAVKAALWEERCLWGVTTPGGREAADARHWAAGFTLWGCGRDGKAFYRALSPAGRSLVRGWADVDAAKIGNLHPLPNSREQVANEAAIRLAGLDLPDSSKGRRGAGGESNRAKKRRLWKERAAGEGAAGSAVEGGSQGESGSEHTGAPPTPPPVPLPGPRPITHFLQAQPPILVLVAQDMGGEALRDNVRALDSKLAAAAGVGGGRARDEAPGDGAVVLVEGHNLIYMM